MVTHSQYQLVSVLALEAVPEIGDAGLAPLGDEVHQVVLDCQQRGRKRQQAELGDVKGFPLSNGAVRESRRWQWRRRSGGGDGFRVPSTGWTLGTSWATIVNVGRVRLEKRQGAWLVRDVCARTSELFNIITSNRKKIGICRGTVQTHSFKSLKMSAAGRMSIRNCRKS